MKPLIKLVNWINHVDFYHDIVLEIYKINTVH